MHLWPSMRLRDSFKEAYLKKLDWNMNRMNSQKQDQSSNLLDDDSVSKGCGGIALFCREIFMIVSCCYCCFCCGACIEDEESR